MWWHGQEGLGLDQVHEISMLVPAGKLELAAECVPLLPTFPQTRPAARQKVRGRGSSPASWSPVPLAQ